MSLEAASVKEESDTMTDAVVIKEEESEPDCVEVPYVAIEADIVDVEFDPPVPPAEEELYSKESSEPAVYLDGQDELLKRQYAENIKDELVLEPECIQRVNTGFTRLPNEKFYPILTDCWVRKERCEATEKALNKQLALKKQLAELYVKENRMHTRMRDDEDFFCEKCKQNENFEFCEACNTNMRALNQLRSLRRKRQQKPYTCGICRKKFQKSNHLYQHKFLIHGNSKILQKMKNPTEFYSAYLTRVYSEKTICGSTSNLPNTTKINTEKSIPIKYNVTETRKVQRAKNDVHIVNPENMVPILAHKNEKQFYCCNMCNERTVADKLCIDCEKEKALNQLSNLYVTKVRIGNNKFVDKTMISMFERPARVRNGKRRVSCTKKQKLTTPECFVRLEHCEAAEEALRLKIDAV